VGWLTGTSMATSKQTLMIEQCVGLMGRSMALWKEELMKEHWMLGFLMMMESSSAALHEGP
jgi:hypothetical protein